MEVIFGIIKICGVTFPHTLWGVGGRPVVGEVTGATGYVSAGELRLHFGLGGESQLRDVVVRWPTGETQEFGDLSADQEHELIED